MTVRLAATRRAAPPRVWIDRLVVAVVMGIALLALLTSIAPQRSGPFAIAGIFLPFVFAPLPLLGLVALWRGGRTAKAAVGAGGLLWSGLFLPGLIAFPPNPSPIDQRIAVASWNTLQDNLDAEALRRTVLNAEASVVALQELSPEQRDLLLGDPAIAGRYPYRALYPKDRYLGMGLLSTFPLVDEGNRDYPPVMWARLDVAGRRVLVVNAHPLPGRIAWLHVGDQALPVGFDSLTRDEQIDAVLSLTATLRRPDEPVLLVGDFNVTEREPAYREITARFSDAKRASGGGAQNTWKSWYLINSRLAILRIDYLFFSSQFQATAFSTDCRPSGSDHCLVRGEFVLLPAEPS